MYNSLLIDQSMGLNRRRDDHPEVKVEVIVLSLALSRVYLNLLIDRLNNRIINLSVYQFIN